MLSRSRKDKKKNSFPDSFPIKNFRHIFIMTGTPDESTDKSTDKGTDKGTDNEPQTSDSLSGYGSLKKLLDEAQAAVEKASREGKRQTFDAPATDKVLQSEPAAAAKDPDASQTFCRAEDLLMGVEDFCKAYNASVAGPKPEPLEQVRFHHRHHPCRSREALGAIMPQDSFDSEGFCPPLDLTQYLMPPALTRSATEEEESDFEELPGSPAAMAPLGTEFERYKGLGNDECIADYFAELYGTPSDGESDTGNEGSENLVASNIVVEGSEKNATKQKASEPHQQPQQNVQDAHAPSTPSPLRQVMTTSEISEGRETRAWGDAPEGTVPLQRQRRLGSLFSSSGRAVERAGCRRISPAAEEAPATPASTGFTLAITHVDIFSRDWVYDFICPEEHTQNESYFGIFRADLCWRRTHAAAAGGDLLSRYARDLETLQAVDENAARAAARALAVAPGGWAMAEFEENMRAEIEAAARSIAQELATLHELQPDNSSSTFSAATVAAAAAATTEARRADLATLLELATTLHADYVGLVRKLYVLRERARLVRYYCDKFSAQLGMLLEWKGLSCRSLTHQFKAKGMRMFLCRGVPAMSAHRDHCRQQLIKYQYLAHELASNIRALESAMEMSESQREQVLEMIG